MKDDAVQGGTNGESYLIPENLPNILIAVDSSDNIHVVHLGYKDFGGAARNQPWYYKSSDGGSSLSTVSGMGDYHIYSGGGIATDSNDYVYVSFYAQASTDSENQIYVTKYTDSWSTPERISTFDGMDSYDQTPYTHEVDADDYPYVLWHGKATGYTDYNKIWYAYMNEAGNWATPTLLVSSDSANLYYPHAIWQSNVSQCIPDNSIKYMYDSGDDIYYSTRSTYTPAVNERRYTINLLDRDKTVDLQDESHTVELLDRTLTVKVDTQLS